MGSISIFSIIVTLTFPSQLACQPHDYTTNLTAEPPVNEVIGRLARLIQRYKNHPEYLNVDGLFGFRFAEGELHKTLTHMEALEISGHRSELRELLTVISQVNDKAQQRISSEDPVYFKAFKPLMVGEFDSPDEYYTRLAPLDLENASEPNGYDFYDEPHGDICFQKLMGTFNVSETRRHPYLFNTQTFFLVCTCSRCYVDGDCLHMMTLPDQKLYSLTHQILYFILAEKMECSDVINMLLHPRNVSTLKAELCTAVLPQNEQFLLPDGHSIDYIGHLDLFMEQALICGGMLHYSNFLEERRIRAALEFQDDELGCFGIPKHHRRFPHTREKRVDKMDKDHCSAHTTGLAAGYMAAYLHYKLTSDTLK